jgi:hypothetical protein
MTREERRALLGDDVIAEIHERVAEAPEPSDDLVEDLVPQAAPVGETPPAAQAA